MHTEAIDMLHLVRYALAMNNERITVNNNDEKEQHVMSAGVENNERPLTHIKHKRTDKASFCGVVEKGMLLSSNYIRWAFLRQPICPVCREMAIAPARRHTETLQKRNEY